MKKSCCLKIIFSFFLFIVLINNVNAGVSIDDCGELGKLTIEMTSNGENAGFDAREITCSWEYAGMKNMGSNFGSASDLITHATEVLVGYAYSPSSSGKGGSWGGYTYQRCTSPQAETTATVTCVKNYQGTRHVDSGCAGGYKNGKCIDYYEDVYYTCDEPNSSGGGDSSDCTRTETKSFGPVKGAVNVGAGLATGAAKGYIAGMAGFSCSISLSYSCPSYTCRPNEFNFRACTPRFKDSNGNEVYCVNPDQLFTSEDNSAGAKAVYGIDNFDVTKCKNSYSTVDCGYANILIEGEYYKERGILGANEINLALRLWSYHTNRGGFDALGLSLITAPYGTEEGCSAGEHSDSFIIPPYYNIYSGTYKEYFQRYLELIPDNKDYISPNDSVIHSLIGCNVLGVACNSRLDTVNKAFALLYNTVKGNPYMLDHLNEIYPGGTATPTGVSLEPAEENNVNIIVEYGEVFNNWSSDKEIDCSKLVPGTEEYNRVKPYCQVKITYYDKYGNPHDKLPSSCKKSVGCRYEKIEIAICKENNQNQRIYVHHIKNKATTAVRKLENCTTSGAQVMFTFMTNGNDSWIERDDDGKEELIPYDLPMYICEGNCDNANTRVSDSSGLKCAYNDNREEGDVFTGFVKDPSLRCIVNMKSPTDKYRFDYSQEFGVNTNFCRVYCSDEIEYTFADKVTINSGEDFKFDIRGKITFGKDQDKLITNTITEKRSCVSEINYAKEFSTVVDWKTMYDLDTNPQNISQLYADLSRKAGSEGSRTENLNQVLYDLYTCNFYTEAQITSLTNGLVKKPKENSIGDVYTYATNKYFNKNQAYGLALNKPCTINDTSNTCINMDTISYSGGAEYNGTSDNMKKEDIQRVGSSSATNGRTKIEMDSLTRQALSNIKYCSNRDVSTSTCFQYISNNDLNYSYPSTEPKFDTKLFGRKSVKAPSNDYAYFTVTTDVAFYNKSQFETLPGSGYIVNKKDSSVSKPTNKSLPDYSFPTSKDAYRLCSDETKTIRSMNDVEHIATHSCKVNYEFINISTYYRKNYPDNFYRTVQDKYKHASCYVNVTPTAPKTSPSQYKCDGSCPTTEFKNVNQSDIFPNGIPTGSNWDDEWGKQVKEYIEGTANDDSSEYAEYSITLTPEQIKNIRSYNKSSSLYQNSAIYCDVAESGNYYNCRSEFMDKLRTGAS